MSEQINTVFWQELLGCFKLYSPLNWEELEQILDNMQSFLLYRYQHQCGDTQTLSHKVLKLVDLFGALEAESNIKTF